MLRRSCARLAAAAALLGARAARFDLGVVPVFRAPESQTFSRVVGDAEEIYVRFAHLPSGVRAEQIAFECVGELYHIYHKKGFESYTSPNGFFVRPRLGACGDAHKHELFSQL